MAYSIPYEDILTEGQQAEDYKARKTKMKEDEEQVLKQQSVRRYPSPANNWEDNYGSKHKQNPKQREDAKKGINDDDHEAFKRWDKRHTSDSRRQTDASYVANKDYYSGKRERNSDENARAIDATDRHMRRHPKQYDEYRKAKGKKLYNEEAGIFESVEFI